MNQEELNLYSSVSEDDNKIISKINLELNLRLSSKLCYLSRQIDIVPYDYTLKPLLKSKRRKNKESKRSDKEKSYEFHMFEDHLNNNECQLNNNDNITNNKNHESINSLKYNPITNIIDNNEKNQNSLNKTSVLYKKKTEDFLNWLFVNKQLGESFKNSNNEISLDSINSCHSLNQFYNLKDKEYSSVTQNYNNNQNIEVEPIDLDFDYQNKEQPLKESELKINILKEVAKLDKEKRCRIKFLQKLMAKSNIDKISNHREFYKVNYMGLLEKYNQAKRAYSQTLPRMQMLEIQNNILFEIIGKIHSDDDGITNLLKEFIEIKSFCIHSIMKLKDELGDNYENILNLIIESNSTSEVRPWAKILSGMFNYYEIKVDDTLIQNLNTLYSISKMTQGS